jgi:AraC-like DNA-binding protein
LADELRDLLDSHLATGLTLRAAAAALHAHPDHLVRAFSAAFGLPPHRYLTARRVDAARQRLLDGQSASDVAAAVGFHDQAHLTRHFTRQLGVTPARYARSPRRR